MQTLLFLMASLNAGETTSLFESAEKAQEQEEQQQQQQKEQHFIIKPKTATGENK